MATRHIPLLLLPLLLLASCVVAPGTPVYYQPVYYGPGIGLGTLIAVLVSWSRNKSILLAILCGFLGWIYVIYAILVPKR
jgi:peptidoglycan/LPS O-acetylase OafA/YrhL